MTDGGWTLKSWIQRIRELFPQLECDNEYWVGSVAGISPEIGREVSAVIYRNLRSGIPHRMVVILPHEDGIQFEYRCCRHTSFRPLFYLVVPIVVDSDKWDSLELPITETICRFLDGGKSNKCREDDPLEQNGYHELPTEIMWEDERIVPRGVIIYPEGILDDFEEDPDARY